ncbi:hypothetical protein CHN51_13480 [Sphingorhabdus sp. YGSMI21]|nr:hypothetical protein CHN51_13480 [Sphingorhabdus sp. YGSMI21]
MTQQEQFNEQGHDGNSEKQQLDELIELVSKLLPVTSVQYPKLDNEDGEPVANFCVRHSALHFTKTAGQLAAIAEAMDHGAVMNQSDLTKVAVNSLINSCKLASEIGISSSDLIQGINQKFGR